MQIFSSVSANLFILFAAKVGLFKIWLGIALVLGTIKLGVFMAWALATFKYVPDPYIFYKTVDYKPKFHFDPFNGYHNNADRDEYIHDSTETVDLLLNFFGYR